jgi:hypothetical protein
MVDTWASVTSTWGGLATWAGTGSGAVVTPGGGVPSVSSSQSLALSVRLYVGPSTYIELNDNSTYRIADGSFENQAVTHRRKTAMSPYVEGTYVVSSLRENVTEQMNVYVMGKTSYATRSALTTLQTALEQPMFTIVRTINNWQTVWTCFASDYSMYSSKPLMMASMVRVDIQLQRSPSEIVSLV